MNLNDILAVLASLVTIISGMVVLIRYLQQQNRRQRIVLWFVGVIIVLFGVAVLIIAGRYVAAHTTTVAASAPPPSITATFTPQQMVLNIQRQIPCKSSQTIPAPIVTLNTITFSPTQQQMVWAFTFTNTDEFQNNYLGAGPGTIKLKNQAGEEADATGPATIVTLFPKQTLHELAYFGFIPSHGSHYNFIYSGGDECDGPVIPLDF